MHSASGALIAPDQCLERSAEFLVEDRVQDRIDAGIGISEPEEERVEFPGNWAALADAVDHVQGEEPDPHPTEEGDDDRHSNGSSHLSLLVASPVFLTCRPRHLLLRLPALSEWIDSVQPSAQGPETNHSRFLGHSAGRVHHSRGSEPGFLVGDAEIVTHIDARDVPIGLCLFHSAELVLLCLNTARIVLR